MKSKPSSDKKLLVAMTVYELMQELMQYPPQAYVFLPPTSGTEQYAVVGTEMAEDGVVTLLD